ncbi:MAG: hypothetical protein JO027_06665 [Solirubrobacterales bacterium]|nr:hypothetical protein [Solirubrobacterales bacterium]
MARNSSIRDAKPPVPARGAKNVARAAKSAVGDSDSHLPVPSGIAGKVAKKAAKTMVRKTVEMGAGAVRRAADRAAEASRNAYEAGTSRLVPIQLSIDVAVPINIAWEQWRSWGRLPEGVHRIVDVERDGDSLIGHTAGPREVDWEAEIKDEREDESFAWRSVEGTDVAGLATFHQLSERLTRIELDLDVVPTNPTEAMTLALHVAHRRAEADLRRFKAHVEFISPDAYEERNGNGNGNGTGRKGKRSARSKR